MQQENISFFVSSTFNDMHLERDALHLEVMPGIAPLAARQLCSVQLLDLRWGVDTSNLDERESSRKVLKVCLDGIDRCHPFMIILLGDRYGWIPDRENVDDVITGHHLSGDFFSRSVTELEIQYGLLMNEDAECFIYFREIDYDRLDRKSTAVYRDEDALRREKLVQLKDRLRQKYPSRIRTYHPEIDPATGKLQGVSEFTRLVTADIESILRKNNTEDGTVWQEKEKRAIDRQLRLPENAMIYRAFQTGRLLRAATGSPLVILTGEAGSGKTTLLCQLEPELQKQNVLVIPFFCGRSSSSGSVLSMQQYFAWFLEEQLGVPHPAQPGDAVSQTDSQRWQSRLSDLCSQWHKKHHKKILFLIDALDQLPQADETARFTWAPEGLGTVWSCIASAQPQTRILREHAQVRIGALSREEQEQIIRGQFAGYGKSLDRSVTQNILSLAGSENPLYLRLILTRLLMLYRSDFEEINRRAGSLGAMQSINLYLNQILSSLPENVEELGAAVISYAAGLSSHVLKEKSSSLIRALELIAVSRSGIRLCDLEQAILNEGRTWNTLQFEWLRYFLDFCFTEQSDGRINFNHNSLRTGILKLLGTDTDACHSLLARTLSSSRDETAAGDSFYHILCSGPKSADLLERLFLRIADEKNDRLRIIFAHDLYEMADRDEGGTFRDFLNRFSKAGLWYAALIFQVFLDDRPESRRRLQMLRLISARLLRMLETSPGRDTLLNEIERKFPESGAYLRETEDKAGYDLEIRSLKAQMLVIHADAVHDLENPEKALPYYRKAATLADHVYEMRVSLDRIYASFPAVYIAYIKLADLCMRLNRPEEGILVCIRGINALRSLNRQILFTDENTTAPDLLLQSQMARLAEMTEDSDLKEKVRGKMETACVYALRNYEVNPSQEALHSLFQAEAAYADLLDSMGQTEKSLQYYDRALAHVNKLCAGDYSLSILMNKCSLLINISIVLAKNNSRYAQQYAEMAESASKEAIFLSENDPEPHIMCAFARTVQCGLLLKNSLRMQAADLCYALLDDLEPWLETECEPAFTDRKRLIMELCADMLEILDEPDTVALCREYQNRFSMQAAPV